MKWVWCPVSGDSGNDIDDGEGWLLVLVSETLKKETDRLGTVPCPLETDPASPKTSTPAHQRHVSCSHRVDSGKSGLHAG